MLSVHGIEAFGTIVWVRANRCGIHFDEKLSLEEVIALREFADAFDQHKRRETERAAREFVQGRVRIP